MLQRIANHPVVSTISAVAAFLATVGGAWYFFTAEAPGPALYRFVVWSQSRNVLAAVLIGGGTLIPPFVIGVIAMSAARSKREIGRLKTELVASERRASEMGERLVRGDFLIRAYSPEHAGLSVGLITLKTKDEVAASGMGRMVSPLDLADEHKGLAITRDVLVAERDGAVEALRVKKREYAMEVLERYSNLQFKDGFKPKVTIRYCSYGADYELAIKIKGLFQEQVRWTVTLEIVTSPALERAEHFKVAFDVGMTHSTYGSLVHAFSEGDLLGVTVGIKRFVDREDSDNLIVLVLPSRDSVPAAPTGS